MAELIFKRRGEEVMHYNLNHAVVRMGRGASNDISFPESERQISRFHATLEQRDQRFYLRDLTGNGIAVNGISKQETWLKDGDIFDLGKWDVLFRAETRSSHQPTLIQQEADTLPMISDANHAGQAVLTFQKDGQERCVRLDQPAFTIGSSDQAHLLLSDPHVSSLHCRIYRKDSRYYLRDLDSTNGTWVNGMKVVEVELPDEAEIYLGQFPLKFAQREGEAPQEETTFPGFSGMVSQDPAMHKMFGWVQKMAQNDMPVLIQGPSGVGKELVARALHEEGPRRNQPFIALNCGSISRELIESALFGHEKGAFTGAIQSRMGAFEQAGGGTLFLDEVGDMPLEQQVALLRVLESGTFRRVGGSEELQTQARVITATHKPLNLGVEEGWFREDLYFRINVLFLPIPSLSDRNADIPLLCQYFLQSYAGHRDLAISPGAMKKLQNHSWPGNVRELRNVLQRAIVLVDGLDISEDDIILQTMPGARRDSASDSAPAVTLQENEKITIEQALRQTEGVVSEAARILDVGRSSLYSKMKRLGINPEDFEP